MNIVQPATCKVHKLQELVSIHPVRQPLDVKLALIKRLDLSVVTENLNSYMISIHQCFFSGQQTGMQTLPILYAHTSIAHSSSALLSKDKSSGSKLDHPREL